MKVEKQRLFFAKIRSELNVMCEAICENLFDEAFSSMTGLAEGDIALLTDAAIKAQFSLSRDFEEEPGCLDFLPMFSVISRLSLQMMNKCAESFEQKPDEVQNWMLRTLRDQWVVTRLRHFPPDKLLLPHRELKSYLAQQIKEDVQQSIKQEKGIMTSDEEQKLKERVGVSCWKLMKERKEVVFEQDHAFIQISVEKKGRKSRNGRVILAEATHCEVGVIEDS